MIQLHHNAAREAQILLRFDNGWTASVLPNPGGTAVLAGWASHADSPQFGRMSIVGGGRGSADEIACFLFEVASAAKVAP